MGKSIIITESQYKRLISEQEYQYDTSKNPKTTDNSTTTRLSSGVADIVVDGTLLIKKSITIFNKSLNHKNNVATTFGWSAANEKAGLDFFKDGDISKKLFTISDAAVINPEYIGSLYQLHLDKIKALGDDNKKVLVDNFNYDSKVDGLIKQGYKKIKPTNLEDGEKIKRMNIFNPRLKKEEVWYGVVESPYKLDYSDVENISGTSSSDKTRTPTPSLDYIKTQVPDAFPIKKIRTLSELEIQTKSFEEILIEINKHNEKILKQTIDIFNKTCDKPTGYVVTYSDSSGKPISKLKGEGLPGSKRETWKKPTYNEACKSRKSGVWIVETDNQYKYSCRCLNKEAETSDEIMPWGGTLNPEDLTNVTDVRSGWDQFVDSLTIHTLIQTTAAIVVWVPPYGTALSATLEILDGLIYLNEGELFDAAMSIGFSMLPVLKPITKIGRNGVEKVGEILKGAAELKDEAKSLQYITDNLSNLSKSERKALFSIITNPKDVSEVTKQITNFNKLSKKDQWIKLYESNPNSAKKLTDEARKEIWGDMSKKEKGIYSSALLGTAPLTTDDSVGDITQKTPEEMAKDLSNQGEKKVYCDSQRESNPCMNCIYVPCDDENPDYASNYQKVLNKKSDISKSDIADAFAMMDSEEWE